MIKSYRIKKIRQLRGLTQKELGVRLGFPKSSADVRIAQYEKGARIPRKALLLKMARTLGVAPEALSTPGLGSFNEIAHLLFALEDIFGLRANILDNRLCLSLESNVDLSQNEKLTKLLYAWNEKIQL